MVFRISNISDNLFLIATKGRDVAGAGIDASAGTLSGLRMIEVTIENDFTSIPVPGGSCIEFADDITWDFVGGDGDGDGTGTGTGTGG